MVSWGVGQDRTVTIDQEDGMHNQDQRKLHGMGTTASAALRDALVVRGLGVTAGRSADG